MKLLGDGFTRTMRLAMAAWAGLLIVGKLIFDTFLGKVFRQGSAAALLAFRLLRGRQARVRQVDDIAFLALAIILTGNLFGLIEEALNVLFTTRRIAMHSRQRRSSSSLTMRCKSASFSALSAPRTFRFRQTLFPMQGSQRRRQVAFYGRNRDKRRCSRPASLTCLIHFLSRLALTPLSNVSRDTDTRGSRLAAVRRTFDAVSYR